MNAQEAEDRRIRRTRCCGAQVYGNQPCPTGCEEPK